jgi:hypothetical protein
MRALDGDAWRATLREEIAMLPPHGGETRRARIIAALAGVLVMITGAEGTTALLPNAVHAQTPALGFQVNAGSSDGPDHRTV